MQKTIKDIMKKGVVLGVIGIMSFSMAACGAKTEKTNTDDLKNQIESTEPTEKIMDNTEIDSNVTPQDDMGNIEDNNTTGIPDKKNDVGNTENQTGTELEQNQTENDNTENQTGTGVKKNQSSIGTTNSNKEDSTVQNENN